MPIVPKQIARKGTFYVRGKPVTIDGPRIQGWFQRGKRMLQKGLPVMLPAEHSKKAIPLDDEETKRWAVDGNRGFIADYFLDKDDTLWGMLDVASEQEAARLKGEVKFVSPYILPEFQDGTGEIWNDVIGHVALTANPIDFQQKPFGSTPEQPLSVPSIAFSQLVTEAGAEPIAFSLADQLHEVSGRWQPISLSQGDTMADEPAKKPDDDKKPAEGEGKKTPAGLDKCKEMLTAKGITLPDFTDESSLIEHLIVACTALCEKVKEDAPGDKPGPGDKEEPTQMMMSQMAQMEKTLAEQGKQLTAERAKRAEREEADLIREIDEIFYAGNLKPLDRDNAKRVVLSKKMSVLDANDDDLKEIRMELRSRRKWPKNTELPLDQLTVHLTQEKGKSDPLALSQQGSGGARKPVFSPGDSEEKPPNWVKDPNSTDGQVELGKRMAKM